MPGATTSNQSHGITSTTSDHVAKNVAPDVCYTPNKSATIPHANSVNTDKATEHTSAKTKINEGPVVCQGHAIGPPSVSTDNAACGKGVASGTCQQEARVKVGSPNVKAEDKPVARKTDSTTQNQKNTTGVVTGGDPNDKAKQLADEKKELCKFKDNEKGKDPVNFIMCGHSVVGIQTSSFAVGSATTGCKGGRKCDAGGNLEVITPVEITLQSKRINGKKAGAPPDCDPKTHTKWIVKREKGPHCEELQKEYPSEDKHVLDKDWFKWPAQFEVASDNSGRNALNRGHKKTTPEQRSQMNVAGTIGTVANAAVAVEETVRTFAQFLQCWKADEDPIKVEVEAEACAGKLVYHIHSYPGASCTFKIDEKLIAKIRATVQVIEKILRGAKKICALGGGKVDGEIKVLEGFGFQATVGWAEMQEDKPEIKKYKHHVDRYWSFQVRNELMSKPLAGEASGTIAGPKGNLAKLIAKFGMEVVALLNAFFPSGGTLLAKAINLLGISVTVGVDITCQFNVEVGWEKPAGFTAWPVRLTSGFDCSIDLYVNLKADVNDGSLELSGGIVVKFGPALTAHIPTGDLFKSELRFEAGTIKMGLRGVMKVDTWIYKSKAQQFDYYPEAFQVRYDGFPIPFLSGLK